MLKFIKTKLEKNKGFLKDNLILFLGLFTLNVLGYFFHFYAGRKLGPADYGVLGSLLSLMYLIVMPLSSLQTIISKFVAEFKAKNEYGKISFLISKSLKKAFFYGIIGTLIFCLLSPLIASFLKINKLAPLIILSFFIILGVLLLIIRGLLQGLQKFKLLSLNSVIEGVGKFGVGVLLISLGFGVNGAAIGLVMAYVAALIMVSFFIFKFSKREKERFDTKKIYKYALPILIMLISLTLFYSIDVIFVKHFFDSINAGYYTALALLGKIILFGSLSVSMVMFPKVSESHTLDKEHKTILYKSLLLILFFGGIITLFYFIFPVFTIRSLFGEAYLGVANILGLFGVYMTLFSLIYVLAFYYASINKIKFIYLLALFNILEGFIIWFFHSSLMQVVILLIILMTILFICLFLPILLQKNVQKNFNYNTSIQ